MKRYITDSSQRMHFEMKAQSCAYSEIIRKILKHTDAEMNEIDDQIEKEIEEGKIPDPASIDPMTGEPMAPGAEGMEGEEMEEEGPTGVESIPPADYKRGEF